MLIAIIPIVMCVVAALITRLATRVPWRVVAVQFPSPRPYRESASVMRAIDRPPWLVSIAAAAGFFYAQLTLVTLAVALAGLRWDGIAVGLLPLGALGIAAASAGADLLRPDERAQGRVRVIARGLLAYGIPLVGFGLLHEIVLEQGMGTAMSFGVVGAGLASVGVVVATLILAACKHLDPS